MYNKYFEEIEIGDTLISRARTITETDIVNFSGLTGDWYPLHTDAEYAKNTMFKQRIAHGLLVLSVASALIPLEPGYLVAFYGMDRVRFVNPTFIGDTIHVVAKVTDKQDKGNKGGVVTVEREVKKQTGETVVTTISKALVAKHPDNLHIGTC